MQPIRHIAIIGCGPGGMAAALLLKRAGFDVTLFDQFDTPRPIGSGLLIQPSGQGVMARLGLLDRLEVLGGRVDRLYGLSVREGKIPMRALDMHYRHIAEDAHAIGIHRSSLFDILFDAVNGEGIAIRTGHEFASVREEEACVVPVFSGGEEVGSYDLLIDASGANSPLACGKARKLPYAALWTNVDALPDRGIAQAALEQRYSAARQMAGIMPVGVNPASGNPGMAMFWSVPVGEADRIRREGIDGWRADFGALWPEAKDYAGQVPDMEAFTLAIYRHRTGRCNARPHVLTIGDAWHCTSPQLGQGANMALLDALALAEAITATGDVEAAARDYRATRRDHVQFYQLLSLVFTPMYQSDSALLSALRDRMIHHFARLSPVAKLIAATVSGNLLNNARL